MPTTRVQFVGDAAQLLQTYRTIGASATTLARQMDSLNKASLNIQGIKIPQAFENLDRYVGPVGRKIETTWDGVNKVFKTTTDTFLNLGKEGSFLTGTLKEVHGNTDDVVAAASRYNDVITKGLGPLKQQQAAFTRGIQLSKQRLAAVKAQAAAEVQAGLIDQKTADSIIAREERLFRSRQQRVTAPIAAGLRSEKAAFDAAVANAEADIQRALSAAPRTAPAGFTQIPPNVYRQLQRAQPQLASISDPAALYKQNAQVKLTEDLIHGTTRAQLQFLKANKDGTTSLVQGAVEWDKYGKAVTRFGGNLSGISHLLDQTVRNLQKVIQWTVATTVVFGSLAFAAKELGTLVDLDKNLQRLAITSQQTATQTKASFSDLANVAFETATPLAQVVKAADDIALATRNSGSSSQEYQRDILNLTRAVGIYTNLTGTDTVQATDLLTSAMKQLGIQTEDVIGILSKVTAVAGGQSNAISDITQVLAVMSEASRQAGLSIDQTIATAQVLSQVTAKSPAEIATAFKNLTGSLDSVAGKKALAKFNIDLRDSAGNLRNILDIYGEISDKIRQGVIPAADVKGLVKAIAGGPRRVPDAAALLSNIDTIQSATERSINATNDALIVNAKILDTTQAKLTQLQVVVDRFAFEKFGPALKQSVDVFLGAATQLVDVLNTIDTSLISTVIQIGAFFLAFKIGSGVLTKFLSPLGSIVGAFRAIGLAASESSAAIAKSGFGSFAAKGIGGALAGNVSKLAGGALAGAALTGVTGGTPGQILGGALQGAGASAFLIPTPWTKIGGAIAFAAGTLLQFVTANQDAAQAQADTNKQLANADEALAAFAAYKDARDNIEQMQKTQTELGDSIDTINQKHTKTAEDLALLTDSQSQYVQNTLAMADANAKLQASQETLSNVVPGFDQALKSAKQGLLSKEELDKLITQYQKAILKRTNPDLTLPEDIPVPVPRALPIVPYSNQQYYEQQVQQKGAANVPRPEIARAREIEHAFNGDEILGKQVEFDLRELDQLAGGYEKVKMLFKGGIIDPTTFVHTRENFDLISGAIQQLIDKGDSAGPALKKSFDAFLQGQDAIKAADVNLAIFQARIQALAAVGDPTAGELQKLYDLITKIKNAAADKGDTDTILKSTGYLSDVLSGKKKLSNEGIIEQAKVYAKQLGLLNEVGGKYDFVGKKGQETLTKINPQQVIDENIVLQGILDQMGFSFKVVGDAGATSLQQISQAAVDLAGDIDDVSNKSLADLASKSADLQARLQGGEFKGHMLDFTAENNQINALIANIQKVQENTTNFLTNLNDEQFKTFTGELENYEASLTNIPGLQDATSLSAAQLIDRFFELAQTYNLTGKQIDVLGGKLSELFNALETISKVRAKFTIIGDMDIGPAIATLKKERNALAALLSANKNNPYFSPGAASTSGLGALDQAIAELTSAGKTIGGTSFNDIYKAGGGTGGIGSKKKTGGGAKAAKAGPDVSTIDVPDAIAHAYNRDALIQEAIKRAKALQATIPGAAKDARNDIVEILQGTKNILEVRGVKDDLLRKALEELADIEKKRLDFETKADTIQRIRVGSGSFAAIANVPVNSTTGVSLGSPNGPINVTLNLNGTVLTPAQLAQFADLVASALKRQIANG